MRLKMRIAAGGLAALAFVPGCGEGKPSVDTATTLATVKGVVRVDGKPATEGEVVFDPSNYQRMANQNKAPIGKDGSYEVKTMVGLNVVRLGGALAKKYPVTAYKSEPYTVKDGDNTFDYDFKSK